MQLTALIAELRRAVCNLESSIEDEDRARIFHAPHLIVAHAHPACRRSRRCTQRRRLVLRFDCPAETSEMINVF
jgi:hypothetical protein